MASTFVYWLCIAWTGGIIIAEALFSDLSISLIGVALCLFGVTFVFVSKNGLFKSANDFVILVTLVSCLITGVVGYVWTETRLEKIKRAKAFVHNIQLEKFDATIIREPDVRAQTTWYVVESNTEPPIIIRIGEPRYPKFQIGDIVLVDAKLELPEPFETSGGVFDYPGYLMKDGITHTAFFSGFKKKGEADLWWLKFQRLLISLKENLVNRINNFMPSPQAELVAGMLFGVKRSLGDQLLDELQRVGLIHLVVLSGFNITIMITAVQVLCRPLPKLIQFIVSTLIVIAFVMLVGPTPSVVRSACMALLANVASVFNKSIQGLRLLFFASLIMTALNPLIILHDPSFQLSWLATFGVITLPHLIERKLKYVPVLFGVRATLSQTLSAQATTTPLVIKMTGAISWIAPVSNLIVAPMVAWVMAGGLLLVIFSFLNNYLATFVGLIIAMFCDLILYFVSLFASI